MAYSPVDFLVRRTSMLYFKVDLYATYKDEVLKVMKDLLHYSEQETKNFQKQLDKLYEQATLKEGRGAH